MNLPLDNFIDFSCDGAADMIGVHSKLWSSLKEASLNCILIDVYATNCMADCVHPNTVVKIKNKNFSVGCLPGMESTNMKLVPRSILDSFSVELIKHSNKMLLCPPFK